MSELPKRKKNRLQHFDYSRPGAYFVTVCVADRKPILWDKNVVGADIIRPQNVSLSYYGKAVDLAINQIPMHYNNVNVDYYCIMPNHIDYL